MRDLQLAFRSLRATPVVTLVAVLSLALGIGANTAIFSLINGLLLRPLPVAEPDRLVTISSDTAIRLGFTAGIGWSHAMWTRLRERSGAFDGAFAWSLRDFDLSDRGAMRPVAGLLASGDLLTSLGLTPAAGRLLTRGDDGPGGGPDGPVAVISEGLAQRVFGGAASSVGARLVVEGAPFTVVGVLPAAFVGLEVGRPADLIVPLETAPLIKSASDVLNPRSLVLIVGLRLKRDQSIPAATAALRAIQPDVLGTDGLPELYKEPFALSSLSQGTSSAEPGVPGLRRRYGRPLITMAGGVAFVLLIACANIANVQLARASARRPELAVRVALGAPRWRLAWQLFVESVVLASLGAVAGLLLATWGSRVLVAQLSTLQSPIAMDLSMDGRVLLFTAAVAILATLLSGTIPALRASKVTPGDVLKEMSRGAGHGLRTRLSAGVVIAQVACSLVLVVAAGLFGRTLSGLARIPLGFDADRVLVVEVSTARSAIAPAGRLALHQRLVDAVAGVPGVAQASGSTATPVSLGWLATTIDPTGTPFAPDRQVSVNLVTPEWFATYGTAFRGGRDFGPSDTASGPPVAIVNQALGEKFLTKGPVLGAVVAGRTVVGVVESQVVQGGYKRDGSTRSVRDGASPALYIPLSQSASVEQADAAAFKISVRAAGAPPSSLAPKVGAALSTVDPDVRFAFRPLADDVGAGLMQERLVGRLSSAFGALGLLLAGLGLYGLVSHAVQRQRPEIGIRLALGAPPRQVAGLVIARAAWLVGIGIVLGAAASLWLSRFIVPLLYGVDSHDPLTFAIAGLSLAGVGALASWLPARRAARTNPAEILRGH